MRDNKANVAASFRGGPLDDQIRVVQEALPELRFPGFRANAVRTEIIYRRVGRWMIGEPLHWAYRFEREEVLPT